MNQLIKSKVLMLIMILLLLTSCSSQKMEDTEFESEQFPPNYGMKYEDMKKLHEIYRFWLQGKSKYQDYQLEFEKIGLVTLPTGENYC